MCFQFGDSEESRWTVPIRSLKKPWVRKSCLFDRSRFMGKKLANELVARHWDIFSARGPDPNMQFQD